MAEDWEDKIKLLLAMSIWIGSLAFLGISKWYVPWVEEHIQAPQAVVQMKEEFKFAPDFPWIWCVDNADGWSITKTAGTYAVCIRSAQ